jgi:hypothetical protein
MPIGPVCFTQPLVADHFFFNQTKLRAGFPFTRTPRTTGAQILGMADGSSVVQLPFYRVLEALNAAYYEWQIEYQADFDDEYSLIEDLRAFGRPFLFVDHITVHEAFEAREGSTVFNLKRARASAVITAFNSTEFLDRVFLNDVEQTEVGSSPPGAGEYFWSGDSSIEFPSLAQGDEIMVRYYAAYKVILANPNHSIAQFDDLRRALRIVETQHQAVPA